MTTTSLHDGDPTALGPYQLHARLGGGGMGQVFLGRSPGGRLVAVKAVRPELADDPDFRRRFAAEVEAARKVGGFYTAQVVDADPDATPPWLATAYIVGPTLHRAVGDHGPLPAESVRVLGAGLAEGLTAVHASGVVHRDLKPANVILAEDGPRLIDFGIARALDATSHTRTHTVLGTAAFMSPEQTRGEEVGAASDVFSLGCVLAFAATGRSPFGQGPAHAVAYRVVHADADLAGIPSALSALVGACLAKDPGDRPGLERVLAHLSAPGPAGGGGREVRPWLPDAVTEVIARYRTLALTAVRAPDPQAENGRPRSTPPPREREPGRERPRLVDERLQARGKRSLSLADVPRIAVHAALALFAFVSAVVALHLLGAGPEASDLYHDIGLHDFEDFDDEGVATILMAAQTASGIGAAVCWPLWFLRVRTVAEGFAPGRLRYHASMAVYAWFIPIASLWLPKQIADDIWHASSPTGRSGTMAPARLLHTWWALWLTTSLFGAAWLSTFLSLTEVPWQLSATGPAYLYFEFWSWLTPAMGVVLNALIVATAAVATLYVRRLSDMQAARRDA